MTRPAALTPNKHSMSSEDEEGYVAHGRGLISLLLWLMLEEQKMHLQASAQARPYRRR